jgi:endonuclease YncB( thermonuclease family)
MKKLIIFISLCLCLSACQNRNTANLPEHDYKVKVVGVTDGDTFKGLTVEKQQIKFRIYGIDAPEKKQAYGNRSKQYLSDLIFGKTVCIKIQKQSDRYGRPIVWVYTLDGKDISAEMIKAGMAWHYKQYSKEVEYAELENAARRQKNGLWSDKNPVEPWKYRKSRNKK